MVADVRNHDPVAVQIGAADLLDAGHILALDRTELGEVHLGPGQQIKPRATAGRRGRLGNLGLGAGVARHHGFGEALHIVLRDAALEARALDFGQRHAQLAGKFSHRG